MTDQVATEEKSSADWEYVREAIAERWPQINRDELAECKNDSGDLIEFVKQRVGASSDEVESVVSEFAPSETVVDRVSQAASDQLHRASESAQYAYMRADECIAERPTESVVASFVAGIVVGAAVTALVMSSRPEPSTWDRVRTRSCF
ncbi:hypothetical protein [Allorhodopirellula solitaria]|uniref:Uncharacterized protein n=1 Tax=Allorhodopirellula solitaria TaxID=2527987 RepID=A0A5C5XRW1_9BACT|nr:hypothetical protein [Allorhodopirellula solitaria]TWT65113.1 hypothetical protein CA85_34600 [Allorhodopirellula solitaria]